MAPERAAAAYPNALSFSRTLVRKMQQERWRIERIRLALDEEGRGEGLYDVAIGEDRFHFFTISNVFPPGAKVDRSFGINWDVSAALCQGAWTEPREAVLREEIPKQYEGRYDADVLCFCRGNRSERIFDEVLAALAGGTQPDTGMLASVGYILRSTAFAGNGLFGMRPFEGLGRGHPLGAPYHVQILAAFLLREFVFDLVDSMAQARGGVRLDRRIKRYLGVGNSAGLGLIPFLASHPRIVDRWVRTHEEAMAAARARFVAGSDSCARQYLTLVDKAATYFGEDPRDGNAIFASFARLAEDFRTFHTRLTEMFGHGFSRLPWSMAVDDGTRGLHPESIEIANGLLLELYPDIVRQFEQMLEAVEHTQFAPHMTTAELRLLLGRDYGWLLAGTPRPPTDTALFWYYPVEAPYEPRRGARGRGLGYEYESAMDLPRAIDALSDALAQEAETATAAELAARRPELRAIITRVQSTAGLGYADLRQSYIATDVTPFAACRFLLAFYGMEKFDPRPPRSTKGALLQGAPLADEIGTGVTSEWPFPLVPKLSSGASSSSRAKLVPLRSLESPEISAKAIQQLTANSQASLPQRDSTHIFPLELRKLFTKAFLSQGCSLGVAEELSRLVQSAATLGVDSLDEILDSFVEWSPSAALRVTSLIRVDGSGAPLFVCLPAAIDLASAAALKGRTSHVSIDGAHPSPLCGAAALTAAERGLVCVGADRELGEGWVGGSGPDGPWLIQCRTKILRSALLGSGLEELASSLAQSVSGRYVVVCAPPSHRRIETTLADGVHWDARTINRAVDRANTAGLPITAETLKRLTALAKRALVPEQVEQQIVPAL
jgi:hypothetical protein